MKSDRNSDDLAARLAGAAKMPPPLPPANDKPQIEVAASIESPPATPKIAKAPKTGKGRPRTETTAVTLRPSRELLRRYTNAAADRTRKEGRVVSAQEIMLERLDGGPG